MKQKRQAKILSIIEQYDIETQDELLEKLAEAGFTTTQATISRDIREINLTKVAVAAALDNVEINGLLGSIAGDDTIFLAVRSKDMTDAVMKTIDRMQR